MGGTEHAGRRWVGLVAIIAIAILAACDEPSEPVVLPVASVPVITPPAVILRLGEQIRFTATVPIDRPGQSAAVRWRSLNPGAVSITDSGVATAIGAGTAPIEAERVADP